MSRKRISPKEKTAVTHRIRGRASEYFFAWKFYEYITLERDQLCEPDTGIDVGWDFMKPYTSKKIQVKRFEGHQKSLDLRKKRKNDMEVYMGDEFDYLVIHDVQKDSLIIASIEQLADPKTKGLGLIGPDKCLCRGTVAPYKNQKSPGLINEGLGVLLDKMPDGITFNWNDSPLAEVLDFSGTITFDPEVPDAMECYNMALRYNELKGDHPDKLGDNFLDLVQGGLNTVIDDMSGEGKSLEEIKAILKEEFLNDE